MFNDNELKTFTISYQPYYDQLNKCYRNIITVNGMPMGPIKQLVRRIQFPKLSEFQVESHCVSIPKCGLVLKSISILSCCKNKEGYNLMNPDEIPDLTSFLLNNGYQIETQITNMLNNGNIKVSNKTNIFTVTYYGKNQPSVTYMR